MPPVNTYSLIKTQQSIIKALLYFDVFAYPLKEEELYENSSLKQSFTEFKEDLKFLTAHGFINYENGFYYSAHSSPEIIQKRIAGNSLAETMLPKAFQFSQKIARFPFITGLCISGGLSKNYYDAKSDMDYFVITKDNRLWIARTLYILYYKLLVPKSQKHYYCLNYFVAESHLQIPDHNLFVATELMHLIPTVNFEAYKNVLNDNQWAAAYFQNKKEVTYKGTAGTPRPFFKRLIELFFSGKFGNWIDDLFLRLTLKRWRKKYKNLNDEAFDLQFRTRKHVCKRHSHGFQNKVLSTLTEKISEYEQKFNIKLDVD
jgi:hypothetical protein